MLTRKARFRPMTDASWACPHQRRWSTQICRTGQSGIIRHIRYAQIGKFHERARQPRVCQDERHRQRNRRGRSARQARRRHGGGSPRRRPPPGPPCSPRPLASHPPPPAVGMGTPDAIFWVDDVNAYDLARFGPLLENHPIFPERANITLAHIVDRDHIASRTWERGAGLPRACGSAACATAVAAARLKRANRIVNISLPGGELLIEWRERDDHVLMTGTATFEYEGRFDPALFASVA